MSHWLHICLDVLVMFYRPDSTTQVDPIDLCSVLTEAMGDKELDAVDDLGRTPLHMAAMRGATICSIHLLQVNL